MKEIVVHSLEETKQFATKLGEELFANSCITLEGDLGAGKTTLTKAIGKALGIEETINSPTFTILKEYEGRLPLYHMDAYRLEGLHQDLGFEEYFESDGVCIVEWGSMIEEQLPSERLAIQIYIVDEDVRKIQLVALGKRYEDLLERI